ncbi:MAG TPA: hypothetical protein VKQ32_18615 [Polyangia bacterium]|nr:hypothetical protein [Polyangia bacterium]
MRRVSIASLMALGTVAGCGWLISSDVTETDFALPMKSFSLDASMFNVPTGLMQDVPCGSGQIVTDCCAPPPPLPAPDCTANMISCDQNDSGMMVCMAQMAVSQSAPINLGQEVPALNSVTGVLNIKIKKISYKVDANTLTVNLPDIILYVAPQGVTDPNDPNAQKFGTLPAIASMTTPSGDVVLEPNAAQVLNNYTKNIQAGFTIIAGTTLKVSHAPAGRIDMTISGTLAASL